MWGSRGSGCGARAARRRGARGRPRWWAPDPASQTCLPIFGEWCSPGRRAKCATAALTPAARLLTSSFPVSARGDRHPPRPRGGARPRRWQSASLANRDACRGLRAGERSSVRAKRGAGGGRRAGGMTAKPWWLRLRSRARGVFPGRRRGGPVLRGPPWVPRRRGVWNRGRSSLMNKNFFIFTYLFFCGLFKNPKVPPPHSCPHTRAWQRALG